MIKIATFLSNRASYYRHKSLLSSLLRDRNIRLKCLVTSSLLDPEYENTYEEINDLFDTIRLTNLRKVSSHNEMAYNSNTITKDVWRFLRKNKQDAFIVIADRWEILPAAMAATYMKVPLIHIQGGEDSGNIDQKVRHSVSMLADLHMVSHKQAKEKLQAMGLSNIHVTGCPSLDLIRALGLEHNPSGSVICIFHPHTKEEKQAKSQSLMVKNEVIKFCEENNLTLYWFAPNNDPGNIDVRSSVIDINVIDNLAGERFLKLLARSNFIIGNSSCGIRECSFLGIPAVNIGDRQMQRVCGDNLINCDFSNIHEGMVEAHRTNTCRQALFGDGKSSGRMILTIKEFIWEKRKELKNKR